MKRISACILCFLLLICILTSTVLTSCQNAPDEMSGDNPGSTEPLGDAQASDDSAKNDDDKKPDDTKKPAIPNPIVSEPIASDYKYVALIGVDGAGSFFKNADMPNLESIFQDGAVTHTMLSEAAAISAQNWASMLHGVTFDLHGLTNELLYAGSTYPKDSDMPSVFRVMKEQDPNMTMASFSHWKCINTGIIEDGFDVQKYTSDTDEELTKNICEYIEKIQPRFLFVQYDEADAVGHAQGYETDVYYETLTRLDGYIGQVYATYEKLGILDETLFLVTSDHGGRGKDHGALTVADRHIMFAAAGHTVEKNGEILDMEIRDIAAVILDALGFEAPDSDKWTARVPSGLFEGVEAVERHIYVDKESPRYHEPESTPEYGSSEFIGNVLGDHSLISYLPFDGNIGDTENNNTAESGKLSFMDGYFGQGIKLNDGYVSLNDITLGKNSFSVSFWIDTKISSANPPIFSNKDGKDALNPGVMLYMGNGSIRVNIADGTNSMDESFVLPADYNKGWVHVLLVIDRDAGTVALCYDFGELQVKNIPEELTDASLDALDSINIGQDGTGTHEFKLPCILDEFMIFDGALDADDVLLLANYYGKTAS